ncbi:TIGR03546 family protein [Elusimicrobiota bacterium]
MIWIKLIKKLLKALNADATPSEIAGGVVLGMVIGLTPAFSLINIVIVIFLIILKVNISSAVFSSIIFGIAGYALDPLAHILGRKILLAEKLSDLWTTLYNTPVIPLTAFNNTIVMGSIVISIILMIPVFIFAKKFVVLYREKLKERLEKMKFVKMLKASKLYNLYLKVRP